MHQQAEDCTYRQWYMVKALALSFRDGLRLVLRKSYFCRFFLPQNPERSAPQFLINFFTFWPYPEKMEVRRLLLLFSFGADAVATVVRHGRWPD